MVKWGRFRGFWVLTLGLEWGEMLLGDPWVVKRKNRKEGAKRPNVLLDDPRVVKGNILCSELRHDIDQQSVANHLADCNRQ